MVPLDEFVTGLTPKVKELTERLRFLILSSVPGVEETIKYNVPFYSYNGSLCYLNTQEDHVILGFSNGAKLSNTQGILTESDQQTRHLVYMDLDQYTRGDILSVIHEAVMLNE